MKSPRTVSYTHLDVYKRQILGSRKSNLLKPSGRSFWVSTGLQAGNIMSIGFEKAYALQTDLDVYKRQVRSLLAVIEAADPDIIGNRIPQFIQCLDQIHGRCV